MKDFPIVAKLILNIILFVIYEGVSVLILGFSYLFGKNFFGYKIPLGADSIYHKLGIITLVVVFILTIVFRKYFYVEFGGHEEKINKEEEKKGNNFENTF